MLTTYASTRPDPSCRLDYRHTSLTAIEYGIEDIVAYRHVHARNGHRYRQPLFDPNGSPHLKYRVFWEGDMEADDTWEQILCARFSRIQPLGACVGCNPSLLASITFPKPLSKSLTYRM